MKNKGFTLVELLAVIAILTLVLTMTTSKVINYLKKTKNVTNKEQINTLINIAKIYTEENTEELPEENELNIITLNQ